MLSAFAGGDPAVAVQGFTRSLPIALIQSSMHRPADDVLFKSHQMLCQIRPSRNNSWQEANSTHIHGAKIGVRNMTKHTCHEWFGGWNFTNQQVLQCLSTKFAEILDFWKDPKFQSADACVRRDFLQTRRREVHTTYCPGSKWDLSNPPNTVRMLWTGWCAS